MSVFIIIWVNRPIKYQSKYHIIFIWKRLNQYSTHIFHKMNLLKHLMTFNSGTDPFYGLFRAYHCVKSTLCLSNALEICEKLKNRPPRGGRHTVQWTLDNHELCWLRSNCMRDMQDIYLCCVGSHPFSWFMSLKMTPEESTCSFMFSNYNKKIKQKASQTTDQAPNSPN